MISYVKLYRVKIIVFKSRNAFLLHNCCVCEQAPGSPHTVQQQHSGDGQHPWWEEPSWGLYHRRWPHRSPQVKTDMTLLCYLCYYFSHLFILYFHYFFRYRGLICHYDFSMDSSTQDHILPICRSNYTESSGYSYNIGLAVPYDILKGP